MTDNSNMQPGFVETYVALGRALSTWSHVEDQLCRIYAELMGLRENSRLAGAAFYAIVSFDGKVKSVDAIIKVAVENEDVLVKWNNLKNKLLRKKSFRNQLAHAAVASFQVNDRPSEVFALPYHSFWSTPAMTTEEYIKAVRGGEINPQLQNLKVSEIDRYFEVFRELDSNLFELLGLIRQTLK